MDPVLAAKTAAAMEAGRPFLFMPNQVLEKPEYVDGKMSFVIWLFGITPCGAKTAVRLTGVELEYNLFIPQGASPVKFETEMRQDLMNNDIRFNNVEIRNMKPLKGFTTAPAPVLHITFDTLADRKKCIDLVNELNKTRSIPYQTAGDDSGMKDFYFAKFARDSKMFTTDWNIVRGWSLLGNRTTAQYTITVPAGNIVGITDKQRVQLAAADAALGEALVRDPLICASWDIETHTTNQNGQVPTAADTDFTIFMMNTAFAYHHCETPFLDFSACETDSDVHPDQMILMVCDTPKGVLRAHMEMNAKINPDITEAFGGSRFDWPLYREECKRKSLSARLRQCYSTLLAREENPGDPVKWFFTKENVKIDADTNQELPCVAMFPGCLDIDMQPVFKKMYPKGEVGRGPGSLNFYLAKNGLASKEDMPYKRMFRVYERMKLFKTRTALLCHCGARCELCDTCVPELDLVESIKNAEHVYGPEQLGDPTKCCVCDKLPRCKRDMALVSNYCRVDCVRPHQLMVKRMIVRDKRELSKLSFVCLRDSFFRADGMKVRNKIGHEAAAMGFGFSNKSSSKQNHEKEHYPGAYVLPPTRGLNARRPIKGVDFASLYPSIKMAYNFSPDRIVSSITEARKLLRAGYLLHWIPEFPYEQGETKGVATNLQLKAEGWTVRHRGVTAAGDKTIIGYEKWVTVKGGPLKTPYVYLDKTMREIVRDYAAMPDEVLDTYLRSHNHFEMSYKCPVSETAAELTKLGIEFGPLGDDFNAQLILETTLKGAGCSLGVEMRPIYGGEPLPNETMGVFPTIVQDLFARRVPVKKTFVEYSKLKERYEKGVADGKIPHGGTIEHNGEHLTLAEIVFRANCADATQRGLKVLANTFYGESGNFRSSVYALLVAAGITSAGQMSLKTVLAFIKDLGFTPYYGDTDSLYISAPEHLFKDADDRFEAILMARFGTKDVVQCHEADPDAFTELRTAYWTEMVEISMRAADVLVGQIWDHLIAKQGTLFLKMAYEEVCFPTVLCGKKKYFATAHAETINFSANTDTFIRGIEIIKQGQTKIAIDLGNEFMNEARSPSNVKTLLQIAEDKIRKFYQMPIDPLMFAQMASYKPEKKNVAVQRFVERMRTTYEQCVDGTLRALYEPPEAGDKFKFVVVCKPQTYTPSGKIIDLGQGDRREYLRVFMHYADSETPMVIDRGHYAKSSIVGLFARFIASDPRFFPSGTWDLTDDAQWKIVDEKSNELAKKYLESMCEELEGSSRAAVREEAKRLRREYKASSKVLNGIMTAKYGSRAVDIVSAEGSIVDQMKVCSAVSLTPPEEILERLLSKLTIHKINMRYNGRGGIMDMRRAWLIRRKQTVTDQMFAIARDMAQIRRKYEITLTSRIVVDPDAELFTQEEESVISRADALTREWAGLCMCEADWAALAEAISAARMAALDTLGGSVQSLSRSEVKSVAAGAVSAVKDYGEFWG